jgi:hypothetical protein
METVLRELVAERCPNVEVIYKASVTGVDVTSGRITHASIRRGDKIDKFAWYAVRQVGRKV